MGDIIFSNFLSLLDDTLFLEAVDPNGLYNITQVDMMRKETLKIYMNNYSDNSVSYKALMESIESESITELDNVNRILTRFFELIQSIPECDILLPDIYPTSNKKDILIHNISIHIMSIFQLAPHEMFGITFNYNQYTHHDIYKIIHTLCST